MFLYRGPLKGVYLSLFCLIGFIAFLMVNTTLIDYIRYRRDIRSDSKAIWYNDSYVKQPYVNWKISNTTINKTDTIKSDSEFFYVKETALLDSIEFWTIKKIEIK